MSPAPNMLGCYPAAWGRRAALLPANRDVRHGLAALRQLIQVETDPGLAPDQARGTVKLAAGPELAVFIEHAAGSPEHPLTDGQLAQKFATLAAGRLAESTAQEIREEVDRLETLADVTTLLRLCRRVA